MFFYLLFIIAMSGKNQSIKREVSKWSWVSFFLSALVMLVVILFGVLLVGWWIEELDWEDTETRVVYSVSGAKYNIGDVVYTLVDNKAVTGEITHVSSDNLDWLQYFVTVNNPNYIEECGEAQVLADRWQSYEDISIETMSKCWMGRYKSNTIDHVNEESYYEFQEHQLKKIKWELCDVLFE